MHGLLLAGGKSSRMGQDKASLISGFGGGTWAERALGLLRQHCGSVYLSLRKGQQVPAGGEGVAVLSDAPGMAGPLAGILAALREAPSVAWLVLACDLPRVHSGILAALVAHYAKNPNYPFVAYASSRDGLPEPLCAIYGPAARPILERYAARAHFCPRDILMEEKTMLLSLPDWDWQALTNINTPQDLMAEASAAREVRVAWFGRLAEKRGVREETVTTRADTAGAFLREMGERQLLGAETGGMRIAVNDEFALESHPLQTGDKVAFLPPFAGG